MNSTSTFLTNDTILNISQLNPFVGISQVVDFINLFDPIIFNQFLVEIRVQIDNSTLNFTGDQLTFRVATVIRYPSFLFTTQPEVEMVTVIFEPCSTRVASTSFSFPPSFDLFALGFQVDPHLFCTLAFAACNRTATESGTSTESGTAATNAISPGTTGATSESGAQPSTLVPFDSFESCLVFVNATTPRCISSPFKGNSSLCRLIYVLAALVDPQGQCTNIGPNSMACSNSAPCPRGFNTTESVGNPFGVAIQVGTVPANTTSTNATATTTSSSLKATKTARQPLDPNGNCRVNTLTAVPQSDIPDRHPYDRCYIVETTFATGTVRTSGYALSADRVITSDVHFGPEPTTVSRVYTRYNPGGLPITSFDTHYANAIRCWSADSRRTNVGLRYCVLGMDTPLSIHDSEGHHTYTTITSILSFPGTPTLSLITRNIPTGELIMGTSTEVPRRITFGSVAEWYSTHLAGYLGRGSDDYMLGSPIFVTVATTSLTPGGRTTYNHLLVGLVTDEVVASNPCTVNAGLFVEDGAVQRLLYSF